MAGITKNITVVNFKFNGNTFLTLLTSKTRMTTSKSSEAQNNHGWTNGQSKLLSRCLVIIKRWRGNRIRPTKKPFSEKT